MTKNKKKPSQDFSHMETDIIRATVINNPESETAKRLQKKFQILKKPANQGRGISSF